MILALLVMGLTLGGVVVDENGTAVSQGKVYLGEVIEGEVLVVRQFVLNMSDEPLVFRAIERGSCSCIEATTGRIEAQSLGLVTAKFDSAGYRGYARGALSLSMEPGGAQVAIAVSADVLPPILAAPTVLFLSGTENQWSGRIEIHSPRALRFHGIRGLTDRLHGEVVEVREKGLVLQVDALPEVERGAAGATSITVQMEVLSRMHEVEIQVAVR